MIAHLETGAATDLGPKPDQQDNLLIGPNYLVVADGVSNSRNPEIAAQVAVDAYASIARHRSGTELLDALLDAPRVVSGRLSEQEMSGLSTVAVAVVDDEMRLWLSHLGDSQLLLLREDRVRFVSRPHTEAADADDPSAPERARHTITRFLGAHFLHAPEVTVLRLQPGDLVVGTTDGVHGALSMAELTYAVRNTPTADAAARAILAAAVAKGLTDNATCAVLWARPIEDRTDLPSRS